MALEAAMTGHIVERMKAALRNVEGEPQYKAMSEYAEKLAEALEPFAAMALTSDELDGSLFVYCKLRDLRRAHEALAAYRASTPAAPRMTDAETVELALRRAAATVDSTEQVKFYLLRVADEIAKSLRSRRSA